MKYLLIIPDGLGIRNFLCTRFIDLLLESGDVIVWHALPPEVQDVHRRRWQHRVRWEMLPEFRERIVDRVLTKAKRYAQLYWVREPGSDVELTLMRPSGSWGNRWITRAAQAVGRVNAGSRRIVWLEQLHASVAATAPCMAICEQSLAQWRPDVVFCCHQRAVRAVPPMLAARRLAIPTASFIYSWDNLPKGRMAVQADHYMVWSDWMRQQLLAYYPECSSERVHVVGTPQFEHYVQPQAIVSREQFCRDHGLDPARAIVCFSGGDALTSPYDDLYLADLANAMRQIASPQRPQVLFRRSPAETGERYADVLQQYPEIAVSNPLWISPQRCQSWAHFTPTPEDVTLLANVAYHCDCVANLGSTMGIDFAIFGKPSVFFNYNPGSGRGDWNVYDVYRLPHLRCIHELQPVHWANDAQQLGPQVMHALRHPDEKRAERQAWIDRTVRQPLDGASQRCHAALLQISGRAPVCSGDRDRPRVTACQDAAPVS